MPVTSVSYFTAAGQPAFTTATSVGLPQYLEPLPGATEFTGVRQKMWQVATYYTPPTLSTVATYFATTCYLTGDSSFQEVGGGVMEFTREYNRIPTARTVPNGSTLYQMVGLPAGTAGSLKTLTACSVSGNTATFTCTAHGYSVDDSIFLSVKCTISGVQVVTGTNYRVNAVTTNTFDVLGSAYFSSTLGYGYAVKVLPYRATKQVKTTSFMHYDYALPGVTSGITTYTDFTPEKPFDPILTTTGQSVSDFADLSNALSALTSPTATEYIAMIKAGNFIVAESNISNYKGSILERATLMVRAM